MSIADIEEKLAQLPLYCYHFFDTAALEFNERIRWICQNECPMYGKTWACPPGVGEVAHCKTRCLRYENGLMIATMVEVSDISNLDETLATRPEHEAVTDQVRDIFREVGMNPYILSTEACSICQRCAYLDGQPCRYPEKMHPCVESHGINVVPVMEEAGLEFQFGQNVVTWISLLLF
jgi:predicted metal-binding protein